MADKLPFINIFYSENYILFSSPKIYKKACFINRAGFLINYRL
jgi:hypothetical protein